MQTEQGVTRLLAVSLRQKKDIWLFDKATAVLLEQLSEHIVCHAGMLLAVL